ncbi:MAG: hypothetical protein ABTQ32_24750 [Myxococcaceae bacterium]
MAMRVAVFVLRHRSIGVHVLMLVFVLMTRVTVRVLRSVIVGVPMPVRVAVPVLRAIRHQVFVFMLV